jgi:hypothetical protein
MEEYMVRMVPYEAATQSPKGPASKFYTHTYLLRRGDQARKIAWRTVPKGVSYGLPQIHWWFELLGVKEAFTIVRLGHKRLFKDQNQAGRELLTTAVSMRNSFGFGKEIQFYAQKDNTRSEDFPDPAAGGAEGDEEPRALAEPEGDGDILR